MKLKAIKQTFHNTLDDDYGKEEVENFFFILSEVFFDVKRIDLAMQPDIAVDDSKSFFDALKQLKEQKPIQYIIGETEFYGLKFKVNKDVLIPRPETEELVSWVLKETDAKKEINILDIGTGSGCIAISLAKNLPNARVYALDVSEKALEVAKENADLNAVEVNFIKADVLSLKNRWNLDFNSLEFDIIVSNPPYVRELEKDMMKPNVVDNEPHLALFVKDNNPLLFYDSISEFAQKALKPNGLLFFEINEYLGNETVAILEQHNFNSIELRKDSFGKDRMVKAKR